MKIGLTRYGDTESMDSLKYVFRDLERALGTRHELIRFSPSSVHFSAERRIEKALEFVETCDLIFNREVTEVFRARHHLGKSVPFIHYLLGDLPRGAPGLSQLGRHLTTRDALIANCSGDVGIAKLLFENAQTQLIPFSIDHETFYPYSDERRRATREALGFEPTDKILLYPGRITVEKNVHSILRIFSALLQSVPDARLVIAGDTYGDPFAELGVYPTNFYRSIRNVVRMLNLPEPSVRFVGHLDPDEMRDFYNVADLVVNLSLHHDENFGYSQPEAMACGTPVVGTRWGGLKDTIEDGATGYQIQTTVTETGVRLDWWAALRRIAELLKDDEKRLSFRPSCIRRAAKYSSEAFSRGMNDLVDQLIREKDEPGEPLKITPFAAEYWMKCGVLHLASPPYRRGPRSMELYRAIIEPYAGTSEITHPAERTIDDDDILTLSAPVIPLNEERLFINDPIFPEEMTVPEIHRRWVAPIIVAMTDEPAIRWRRLREIVGTEEEMPEEVPLWLAHVGILAISTPEEGGIDPATIDSRMSRLLFAIRRVKSPCDIVALI